MTKMSWRLDGSVDFALSHWLVHCIGRTSSCTLSSTVHVLGPVIRGRRTVDLKTDPPPDLAIEIEISRRLLDRIDVYRRLGVPGLGGGHLDPARAAEAVSRIRPKLVVPIHWGTYFPIHLGLRGKPGFVDLPPLEFLAAMKETSPDVEVKVLYARDYEHLGAMSAVRAGLSLAAPIIAAKPKRLTKQGCR